MSIRDWAIKQLRKDSRVVEAVGEHAIVVRRQGQPDAVAYCVEPDNVNSFTVDALEDVVDQLPQAGMVIVTRRVIEPDVHERARELEICVDTFGGFNRALGEFDDISQYVHPEAKYIRTRMAATRVVTSVTRLWGARSLRGL
jgi:hypothetical protein